MWMIIPNTMDHKRIVQHNFTYETFDPTHHNVLYP